jgi:hypothetical protein
MIALNTARKGVTFGHRKVNPRVEYRLRRAAQINNSPTLAERFPKLKSLRAVIEHFDCVSTARMGGMKYQINLAHGKSLLSFNCANSHCVGGDYDLTKVLAQAVAAKHTVLEGELRCQGIRHNKELKEKTPCQGILRYKLTLGY